MTTLPPTDSLDTSPSSARRNLAITPGVALGVAVVAGVIASSGTVAEWEASVFHAINGLPDWLCRPMWVFQLVGRGDVPLEGLSFVSGHAIIAWGVAVLLRPVLVVVFGLDSRLPQSPTTPTPAG